MAALGGITVESRETGSEGAERTVREDQTPSLRESTKQKRSKKRKKTNDSNNSGESNVSEEDLMKGNAVQGGKSGDSRRKNVGSTPEDPRARFYEDYRKVAEEYDKEFMKRYDEDLNTTLIFAGLFSAVTSAFIIEVNSQFQPDPNEETAALLRVLIHQMNNTISGDHVPTVPQWSGPPQTIIHVQAMLYASLAASLFAAFLAMLGKQWLNRYASTDIRGSAIERSQNRQQKLNGIVTWYFDHVMESLPLMLQIALLLLGCALSNYLWGIDITTASVVLAVTSFGAISYPFVVVAGTASVSCPYQTPGARILRYTLGVIRSALRALFVFIEDSYLYRLSAACLDGSGCHWVLGIIGIIPMILVGSSIDAFQLGQTIARAVAALARRACARFLVAISTPTAPRTTLDLDCISWILKTSLDKDVHLSTMEYLTALVALADFDPVLVVDCFNILVGCVKVVNNHAVTTQGLEQLATTSAICLLRTFSHLSVMDPTSGVLIDIRQRYNRVFPPWTNFEGLPFFHTLGSIHNLFHPDYDNLLFGWDDYSPSSHEHLTVAHALAELAQFEYRRRERRKVPRWILRFALYTLSQDSLPPTPAIINCLSIIAIDLDCDVSSEGAMTLDESARLEEVSALITRKLAAAIRAGDPHLIASKSEAIAALFPYAIWREQAGERDVFDTFLHLASELGRFGSAWHRIEPLVVTMLDEGSHVSLKEAIVLGAPRFDWKKFGNGECLIQMWAAAVLEIPYADNIGQSVVDVLLQIAYLGHLRPHIPVDMWLWLDKRPPLPPVCFGRRLGTTKGVVRTVRELGDVEILKKCIL